MPHLIVLVLALLFLLCMELLIFWHLFTLSNLGVLPFAQYRLFFYSLLFLGLLIGLLYVHSLQLVILFGLLFLVFLLFALVFATDEAVWRRTL